MRESAGERKERVGRLLVALMHARERRRTKGKNRKIVSGSYACARAQANVRKESEDC